MDSTTVKRCIEALDEYSAIIRSRIANPLMGGEVHHIVPESYGGADDNDNLIVLAPDEHRRCRELLGYLARFAQ